LRGGKRQRHAVGPAKPVLRWVLSAAGAALQVDDVVLLHHSPRLAVRPLNQREPPAHRLIGEIVPAVVTHAFDRQPLERRPAVGGIPLLPGRDLRGDEAAGLQEFDLQSRGDANPLFRRSDLEVERSSGGQGRSIHDALAGTPPDVVEETQ
jgi:hypothetical protein